MPAAVNRGRSLTAYAARFAVSLLSLLLWPLACASNPVGPATSQGSGTRIVLGPGESRRVPQTDLTLTFVRVVSDSRCPAGVTCIREGEAVVVVRAETPASAAADLTLSTSGPGPRDAAVGSLLVTLVDVTPYPREDHPPGAEEYRVTMLIRRE